MFGCMRSRPTDAIDFSALRRVLVVKLRHHGDVLLTTPVFAALKSHAGQAELDALVYADTREMLDGHPAIAQVHTVGRDWRGLAAPTRLARELGLLSDLRQRNYDLLIHLSEHPRGAWLARTLGCRHSVAPGYGDRSRFWKRSFSHLFALPLNAHRHMAEWNLDSLRRLGLQPGPDDRRLMLVPGAEAESQTLELLASAGLADRSFIQLHPASRWAFKCWPAARTAGLVDSLMARGERLVITAAPSAEERKLVDAILAKCSSRPVDLSGKLSLKALAALTARAKLFIGVDSAPMHIASAVGTPVVALFGPSGEHEWGPWMVRHQVVSSKTHHCRPCGRDGCGGGKVSDCLEYLPESQVLSAVDAMLLV